jgi:hypothetical protein
MLDTVSPEKRLEEWLNEVELPDIAKTCLENFVYSCEQPKIEDVDNFICIDFEYFRPAVKYKLLMGLIYSYYSLKPAIYTQENMLDEVNLN